jgi:sugar-specific transcriptional regulator TrmB
MFPKVKDGLSPAVGEEANKVLRELGLTAYESAAYLSLIASGVMTASEVSERADVPFSKVYEALNSLDRKGWVEVERGRPSRYFAKPPAEAFEAARRQLHEQMRRRERVVLKELQPLYEKREFREKPDIWILRGETSVLTKLQEMLTKARREVMIAMPLFVKDLAEKVLPLMAGLTLSNVKALVMVTSAEDWDLDEATKRAADVRERDNLFGGGVIVDGAEALLFLGEDKPSLVVWSNHGGLVKFARDYFQHLWNSSTEI